MVNQATKTNFFTFVILGLMLSFLSINFDFQASQIFFGLLIVSFILFITDLTLPPKIIGITVENNKQNRRQSLVVTLAVTAGFLLLSTIVITQAAIFIPSEVVDTENVNVFSTYTLLATNNPILNDDPFTIFLMWGILIPIVETFFLAFVVERFADTFRVPLRFDPKNNRVWLLIASIGFLFGVYHLTVRQFDGLGMLVTILFGMITAGMILHYRESKQAMLFHVIVNSRAIAATLFSVTAVFGLPI